MSPPPEYSDSFAQTTEDHVGDASKRLSLLTPLEHVDQDDQGKLRPHLL